MSHVYPVTEVYGSSETSIDDAIRQAVRTTSQSIDHVEWIEVTQIRGHVAEGEVKHFQVGVKLGFRLDR